MNIFEALKLVGHFPIVEGFWRNISVAVGMIGVLALLFLVIILEVSIANWAFGFLLFTFVIMATLPIYLPRKSKK